MNSTCASVSIKRIKVVLKQMPSRCLDQPQSEFFEVIAGRNRRWYHFKMLRRKAAFSIRLSGPLNSLPVHSPTLGISSGFRGLREVVLRL